jgi:hypothetical protein
VQLTFAAPLDKVVAEDLDRYTVTTWDLKRTRNYGSKRYNTRVLTIERVTLSEDAKTLMIHLPEVQPTWVMEIQYQLSGSDGEPFDGVVQNTIYALENP